MKQQRDVERVLAGIWQDVLGRDEVEVHDDFFRLGGDSILIMQVVARARKQGIRLRARDFFAHTTISELAAIAIATGTMPAAAPEHHEQDDGPIPLSPMQDWFFAQNPSDPNGLQQSVLVTIDEPVEHPALRAALRGLVAHHDALRLRFWTGEDGRWMQQPAAADDILSVPLDIVDTSGRHRNDVIAERTAAAERAIRIGQPPLLRTVLFEHGPADAELLMIAHHLAVDTVSWQILVEDLVALYDAAVDGRPGSPATTSSFASWARRVGKTGFASTPRAERAGGQIQTVAFRLGSDLTASLAEHRSGSVQEVLLAGLAEAIPVLGESGEWVVDVEQHGRDDDDLDVLRTVGWFTRVVPLALPDAGAPDLLGEIRERLANLPEVPDGRPTAPVAFNYLGRLSTGGQPRWPWRPRLTSDSDADRTLAPPLTVVARVAGDELLVDLQYNSRAFDDGLVRSLASAYAAALKRRATTDSEQVQEFELTPMQLGMLFPALRGDGSYVEQRVWRLPNAEVDRHARAWQDLFTRHDALRTGIRWRDRAEPVQFFAPTVSLPVNEFDFADEHEFAEFLRQDRVRGFDLEQPPLARLAKVRVGSEESRLVLTDHHLLTDGWSYGQLCEELATLVDGGQLPAPAPSFRTYIDWLRSQSVDEALDFWRTRLKDLRPLLVGRQEPETGYYEYLVRLDDETSRLLREEVPGRGLTLSSVAHGCWALALGAFTARSDVVFASTYAVRPTDIPDVERIIGPMIATVPVRVPVDAHQLVMDLLLDLQSHLVETREQAPVPLGVAVAAAGLGSAAGLCDAAIAFENFPLPQRFRGSAEGVNMISGEVRPALTQPDFALTLIVRPMDDEIGLRFVYDAARVATERVRILADLVAGKFDEFARQAGERAAPAPAGVRTTVLARLAEIWADALGVAEVHPDDDFFELGGHSLVAMRIAGKAMQVFEIDLPVDAAFELPTVAAMAEAITERLASPNRASDR